MPDMPDLQRLREVTERYPHLQGLRLVPLVFRSCSPPCGRRHNSTACRTHLASIPNGGS